MTTATTASVSREIDTHIVTLLSKLTTLREHNQQQRRRREEQMERRHRMSYELRSMELWRAVAVECYATFLFTFIVNAPASTYQISNNGYNSNYYQNLLSILATAVACGFGIAAIQMIFGHISGGHVNPAVSTSFAISRKVSPLRAVLYIAAQCGGGIAGTAMLYGVLPSGRSASMLLAVSINDQPISKFLVELSLSTFIVLAHHATESPRALPSTISGKPASVLAAAYTSCYLVTNTFLNPARALGPAFVLNRWENHWIFWLGPVIGGALAAILHEFVLSGNRRSREIRDIDDGENSSMRSDDETYDDLDKNGHPKFPTGYATYRPVTGAASIYAPHPATLDRVESIYGGTKSLYCKSPPLTRANLNRSQSVYAKSTTGTRDGLILPKAGPLVPAQSLYPIRLNSLNTQPSMRETLQSSSPQASTISSQPSQQNHNSTNQNMQNQLQQCNQNIYGIRGIASSISNRDNIYGHLGNRENGSITTGSSSIYGRAPVPPPSNHGPSSQHHQQQSHHQQQPPHQQQQQSHHQQQQQPLQVQQSQSPPTRENIQSSRESPGQRPHPCDTRESIYGTHIRHGDDSAYGSYQGSSRGLYGKTGGPSPPAPPPHGYQGRPSHSGGIQVNVGQQQSNYGRHSPNPPQY